MKKYLKLALKIGVVVGLLVFLSQKGFLSVQDTRRAFSHWENIIFSVSISLFCALMGAIRWQWLLEAQGIELGTLRTCELTFVGNFFNVALPGAVSGDVIKAFYIGREVHGQRARAFGSILFDRVAGLSVLMLISAIALPFGEPAFAAALPGSAPLLATIKPFIMIAGGGFLFFYAYLFLVRDHFDPVLIALHKLQKAMPKVHAIVRIYESIRHYHHHRWVVVRVFLLSMFIQLLIGLSVVSFARALGEPTLPAAGIYTLFPLGLLVTAVPVAPAGVGTGHAAFAGLFRILGSTNGANVFTLVAMTQLLIGAIGGLVYLRFRSAAPQEAVVAQSSPLL
ncbi:MAG: lysylphosphatidylglycerol synthase transmembrane domain-containing protein [Oligoflexia bacterium]|nr:lysylphosphatidylglycerol synthase transmembrane domain-containing protein [Oligoflexia bacterium]